MATFSIVETSFILLSLIAIIPFHDVEKMVTELRILIKNGTRFVQLFRLGKGNYKVAEISA